MSKQSKIDHFHKLLVEENKFIHKMQHTQKAAKILIAEEKRKEEEKEKYQLNEDVLNKLLSFYQKIREEDLRCFAEFQLRLAALLGKKGTKRMKELRQKANKKRYEHYHSKPKKGGILRDQGDSNNS